MANCMDMLQQKFNMSLDPNIRRPDDITNVFAKRSFPKMTQHWCELMLMMLRHTVGKI